MNCLANHRIGLCTLLTTLLAFAPAARADAASAEVETAISLRTRSLSGRDSLVEALTAIQLSQVDRGVRAATPGLAGFRPVDQGEYTLFFADSGRFQLRKTPFDPIDPRALILGPDAWEFPGLKGPRDFKKSGCPLTPTKDGVATPIVGRGRYAPILLLAVANLDGDPQPDCWSIANVVRTTSSGMAIPAGVPFHEASDWDEALLVGIPETEELLLADMDRIARVVGEVWHMFDIAPISLAETRQLLPSASFPERDPWGTPYALAQPSDETRAVVSAGADRLLGSPDDAVLLAPRRAGDSDGKAHAAVIDALAAKGIVDRDAIDRAIQEDDARRKVERAAMRQKVLDMRGFSE